jgi:hypothetical protein
MLTANNIFANTIAIHIFSNRMLFSAFKPKFADPKNSERRDRDHDFDSFGGGGRFGGGFDREMNRFGGGYNDNRDRGRYSTNIIIGIVLAAKS